MDLFGRMSFGGALRRGYNGLNKLASRAMVPMFVRPRPVDEPLAFGGAGDGAWPILRSLLPQRAICYCIGVGTNASFDLFLNSLGYEVHSFDPTPRALQYAKESNLEAQGIRFHPIGVWDKEIELKFYEPANPAHVNFSVSDLHGTGRFVVARCERLSAIMQRLGHQRIDVLKLDVEGSWRPILDDMLESRIYPSQLCVEFDSPTSTYKILSMVRQLSKASYRPIWMHRENFFFIRNETATT